jgi:hypothetical protein
MLLDLHGTFPRDESRFYPEITAQQMKMESSRHKAVYCAGAVSQKPFRGQYLNLRSTTMSRKRNLAFGIMILVILMNASSSLVAAPGGLSLNIVSGTISTIDFVTREVRIKKNDGSSLILGIPSSAAIKRNRIDATLSSLALGDNIVALCNSLTMNASYLTSRGMDMSQSRGRIEKVFKPTGEIVVGLLIFKTDANTKIVRNGQVVFFNQLTRKDEVVVHTKPETNLAQDVIAGGPTQRHVVGKISVVNGVTKTVGIEPCNGTPMITLTVDATTMIEVNHLQATLADLLAGMSVEAAYDPTTGAAFSIEAESPGEEAEVVGMVAGVDTMNGTISINPSAGGPMITLSVNSATEIEVNDIRALLADVKVSMSVEAEYDVRTLLAEEIEAGTGDDLEDEEAEVEGTVSAVGSSSITITPDQGGASIALTVDGATTIKINGKPGTLAEIKIGDSIEAKYDKLTLVAVKLSVEREDEKGAWAEVEGKVSAVSSGGIIVDPDQGGGPIALKVDSSTEIKINGKPGTLAGIKVGDSIEAKYDTLTLVAAKLSVDREDEKGAWAEVEGKVSAVGGGGVTVNPGHGGGPIALKVDSSTEIKINGKPGTLAGIKVGDSIEAKYDTLTLVAAKLSVDRKD